MGDDEIVAGEERLRVLWERLAILFPEGTRARYDKDDIDHGVEIGVSDAGVKDQAPQQGRWISEIVEDIASECPCPGAWHDRCVWMSRRWLAGEVWWGNSGMRRDWPFNDDGKLRDSR